MDEISQVVGQLQAGVASLSERVTEGFGGLNKRMDTGRDANITAQGQIIAQMKDHDQKYEDRHKEILILMEKYRVEHDERITSLETTRIEYQTTSRNTRWAAAVALALATFAVSVAGVVYAGM